MSLQRRESRQAGSEDSTHIQDLKSIQCQQRGRLPGQAQIEVLVSAASVNERVTKTALKSEQLQMTCPSLLLPFYMNSYVQLTPLSSGRTVFMCSLWEDKRNSKNQDNSVV